ncbi:unnamed protein product [Closterium sp. NIES-53]
MDVWGPVCVSGQGRERYFLLVVNDYTRYTTVFPLRSKGEDLPVLRLHSDRGGDFSSDLLREFCRGEGITQSFTLPDSPQQNGIAERRIGLVMEVARTSMIHAAAPHFLWPFAVWYAAHQLNLWPHVSSPKTSSTLRWTGEVGDALIHPPTLCCVFPVQDVTYDESVPFYRLFPYRSAPPPPPSLFLAPGPPPVDPLPPQGPAPSGVSPRPSPWYCACCGSWRLWCCSRYASGGTASGGVEPGGVESDGAGSRGAEPRCAQPKGTERAGVEPRGGEPEGVEPRGAESEGVECGGAKPQCAASSRGPAGAPPRLSPRPEPLSLQQLREWLVRRTHLRSGAARAGATGDTGAGGAGVTAKAGGTGVTAAAGPGGAHTRGTRAAGTGGVGGAGAGDPTEPGAARAGARGAGAGGTGASGTGAGGAGAGGAGAEGAGAEELELFTLEREVLELGQVLCFLSSTSLTPPLLCPPPDPSQPLLQPASPIPAPSPYTEQSSGLTERREPASHPVSHVCTTRRDPRSHPPPVPGTHAMTLRPSSVPLRVPLLLPPESYLPAVPDLESDRARAASPSISRLLATVVTNPYFGSTTASTLIAELVEFAAAYRLNYATALVAESGSASPPSIGDECALRTDVFEDRQEDLKCLAAAAAMDAEMASTKSTGTYINAVPPSLAKIIDGMWIFRGVDYFQTFSPTPKMTTLRVLLHVAAQRNYELHSLDFSTAFLHGSLHKEIWLRRSPGFTGLFPARTQWSLRWPVYGLRQASREWHDTLRTTLAALGFAPPTTDPSLVLRTDTSLRPLNVLVYVDGLIFATAELRSFSASLVDDSATQLMAAQELRWLIYLLIDLGEQPRSPPVLYVDNKAMIALCQEHILEHRTKRIALRYFLAPELQRRGQLHLAYVATRANTAGIFTKALAPGVHQRFSTVFGLVPTLPHLLTA